MNNLGSFSSDLAVPTRGAELFIGLVGAVGTDMGQLYSYIEEALAPLSYSCVPLKLSNLIRNYSNEVDDSSLFRKYETLMDCGSKLRKDLGRTDALAIAAIVELWAEREDYWEKKQPSKAADSKEAVKLAEPTDKTEQQQSSFQPTSFQAFIFDQLKNPGEIKTLRLIYGKSFYLIGAYSSKKNRTNNLARRMFNEGKSIETEDDFSKYAETLIKTDYDELKYGEYGQKIRASFPEADVFINMDDEELAKDSIRRFIELVFGNSFKTPTIDELGMYLAQSTAYRSADLARQIGASVLTPEGDVVSVGCNEASKHGGGQYWEELKPDHRDFHKERDANDLMKQQMLLDVLQRLQEIEWVDKTDTEVHTLVEQTFKRKKSSLHGVKLMDVIEYFRSVHAEMACLMDAAKRGLPVSGDTLYSTTFPCHECARHIICAGIARVVYVEPYPKSLALQLFGDSISLENDEKEGVKFVPFVGIAPRQYMSLFSLGEGKRKDNLGYVQKWNPRNASLKHWELPEFYSYKEARYIKLVKKQLEDLRKSVAETRSEDDEETGSGATAASEGGTIS